jgi:hypothetical protein
MDMVNADLESIVFDIVSEIATGDCKTLISQYPNSRVKAIDIESAIKEYGRVIIPPPQGAYSDLDAVVVKGASQPTWSVRAPLWTKEEGRSDLTLEMTITLRIGEQNVMIDDLRVL